MRLRNTSQSQLYELVQIVLAELSWNTSLDVDAFGKRYLADRNDVAADQLAEYVAHTSKDPEGYSAPARVARGIADYTASDDALQRLPRRSRRSPVPLVERLRWNLKIAKADLRLAAYQLSEPDNVAAGQARLRDLFTLHRFDGVAPFDILTARRWNPKVTNAFRHDVAAAYRSPAYGFADDGVTVPRGGAAT